MRTREEIQEEIDGVIEFTCSYWYPAYEAAEKSTEDTPTAAAVIWDIIKMRSAYVESLKQELRWLALKKQV